MVGQDTHHLVSEKWILKLFVGTISLDFASLEICAGKDILKKFVTTKIVKPVSVERDTLECADSSKNLEGASLGSSADSSM